MSSPSAKQWVIRAVIQTLHGALLGDLSLAVEPSEAAIGVAGPGTEGQEPLRLLGKPVALRFFEQPGHADSLHRADSRARS